jgi:hypothetical protein
MVTEQRAGSNAKANRDLSWQPTYASWRQGFVDVLAMHAWLCWKSRTLGRDQDEGGAASSVIGVLKVARGFFTAHSRCTIETIASSRRRRRSASTTSLAP